MCTPPAEDVEDRRSSASAAGAQQHVPCDKESVHPETSLPALSNSPSVSLRLRVNDPGIAHSDDEEEDEPVVLRELGLI